MTARLTQAIVGVLRQFRPEVPTLRYVTDAACHPQPYFREVLAKTKHPVSGEQLNWSWGVDFFHACEYVAKLAGAMRVNRPASGPKNSGRFFVTKRTVSRA